MSQPYVGEIRIVGLNFAPVGWAFCNGALLAISQNAELFDLIGTTYGGDGLSTFALPDLRGRMPVHIGNSYPIGATGGAEIVTVTDASLPTHSHGAAAVAGHGDVAGPSGAVWATASGSVNPYSTAAPGAAMNGLAIGTDGGGQPHENMSPYVVVNFVISLFGVFPSQN